MYCVIGFLIPTAVALEKLMKYSSRHGNLFLFRISFLWKTKDPMVKITLDDYTTIFGLTPTGIIRYLRLLKPVDREKQMVYTFTVGLRFSVAICKTTLKPCDLHLLCVLIEVTG